MRDRGDPHQREFDELVGRALAAWREEEPAEGDGPLPGGVAPGFAARVMAAEHMVVDLPVVVVPQPAGRKGRFGPVRASFLAGLAACLAVTTGAALWALGRPDPAPSPSSPVPAVAGTLERQLVAQGEVTPIPADLAEQIDNYVGGYGRHFGPTFAFHGAIVVARGGHLYYAKAFGSADPERGVPNRLQTRFRIGMLTEQFTAAAILQLRDAGMLDLDDPISRFFPGFPRGTEITVAHLLEHTSGIPNYTDLPTFQGWKSLPHRSEELIGRFSDLPLEFAPGTDFRPTNSGYFLLGAIIERVSGLGYGEYMERFVFAPAGLRQTTFGDAYETGEQARGQVWNAEEKLEPPDPIDMSVFGGAGGLVSSALDLVRWNDALDGDGVLSAASRDEMLAGNRYGYGYGWLVGEAFGRRLASFPGAIDGFNAAMMRFVDDRTFVLVMCNTEVAPAGRIARDVAAIVYSHSPLPRIEYPEVQVAPGTLTRYVGTYGVTAETVRRLGATDEAQLALLKRVYVRQVGDRLYFDVPGHGSTWMHPMGKHRFFFKDNTGNYLSFVLAQGGRAGAAIVHYGDIDLALERFDD